MSRKYRKITATLVVRASATNQIERELTQAVEIIASEHFVYQYCVEDRRSAEPANAADYDMD